MTAANYSASGRRLTHLDPPEDRFWDKVEKTDGCWIWRGTQNAYGYGRFQVNGKLVAAHRWSYVAAYGPFPDGYFTDHLCGNRLCVRPDHLEAVTNAENVRRGKKWLRDVTHCRRGHPYEGDNLRVYINKHGHRVRRCTICRDAWQRGWRSGQPLQEELFR